MVSSGILKSISVKIVAGAFILALLLSLGIAAQKKKDAFLKRFSFASLRDGSFQVSVEKGFSDNFPFRSFFLSALAQFDYSVLNSGYKDWLLGKNKHFFYKSATQTWASGKIPKEISVGHLKSFAKKVRAFQDSIDSAYDGKKRDFVFLFTPTKSQICSESLPWNYELISKRHAKSSGNYSETIKKIFDNYGIRYVDMTLAVEAQKNKGLFVFPKNSMHWTVSSAGRAVQGLFEKRDDLFENTKLPTFSVEDVPGEMMLEDKEITWLLGLRKFALDENYTVPQIQCGERSGDSLFMFATSFGANAMKALFLSGDKNENAFDKGYYYMYNSYFCLYSGDGASPVFFDSEQPMADRAFLDAIKNSTLVIMEAQLVASDFMLAAYDAFLDYVNPLLEKN